MSTHNTSAHKHVTHKKKPAAQTQSTHRRLAAVFGIITGVFLLLIVYFAFSSTTVTLKQIPQPVTVIFPISIQAELAEDNAVDAIAGTFVSTETTVEASLTELGSSVTVTGKAHGTITIINNYSKSQPLAATTRLQTSDGILFRTDEFVEIPAGGRVDVAVTADQAGSDGDIEPSHFTIPGLWSGLQDIIYGESTAAMSGGQLEQVVVSEENLNTLRADLRLALTEAASAELDELIASADSFVTAQQTSVFSELNSESFSAEVGEVTETLSATATGTVLAVAYDTTDLMDIIGKKLTLQMPDGVVVSTLANEDVALTLESYDGANSAASLQVTASTNGIIDLDHDSFLAKNITNKSRQEIIDYYSDFATVESVTVNFSPFWVYRSPSIANNINLTIN